MPPRLFLTAAISPSFKTKQKKPPSRLYSTLSSSTTTQMPLSITSDQVRGQLKMLELQESTRLGQCVSLTAELGEPLQSAAGEGAHPGLSYVYKVLLEL